MLLEQVAPEISMSLIATICAIIQQASFYYSVVSERLANMEHAVNAIATGKITMQFGHKTPLPGSVSPSTIVVGTLPPSHPSQLLQDNASAALVVSTTALSAATLPPLQLQGPPAYIMAGNKTVPDLWREWTVGFFEQPSIESLEKMWGYR
jgi:hypothetical protein